MAAMRSGDRILPDDRYGIFAATILKIAQGGWFPLAIGAVIYFVMVTWNRGRHILLEHLRSAAIPLMPFLESLTAHPPVRVAGTSVF